MRWRLELSTKRRAWRSSCPSTTCLADLLYPRERELTASPLIISNHHDAERLAGFTRIPFTSWRSRKTEKQERSDSNRVVASSTPLTSLSRAVHADSVTGIRAGIHSKYQRAHSFLPHSAVRDRIIGPSSAREADRRDESLLRKRWTTGRSSNRTSCASRTRSLDDLIQKGRDLEKGCCRVPALAHRAPDLSIQKRRSCLISALSKLIGMLGRASSRRAERDVVYDGGSAGASPPNQI